MRLREPHDTITNKALRQFGAVFSRADTLVKRFDQPGVLRNGIRQSRTVDEMTRRDGEAVLAWCRGGA